MTVVEWPQGWGLLVSTMVRMGFLRGSGKQATNEQLPNRDRPMDHDVFPIPFLLAGLNLRRRKNLSCLVFSILRASVYNF